MNEETPVLDIPSWVFGIIAFAIGILNMFWGNDPGLGVFILLFSFVYFPPANAGFTKWTDLPIPGFVKIILGIFIMWAALSVGELFDKIGKMNQNL